MHSPLLTDLYQLTMGQAAWKNALADREAVFHLFYRRPPFGGQAVLAAGIDPALDFLADLHVAPSELAYLASLTGNDGRPLFEAGYLAYLRELAWQLTVHAVPEGELVLPHEPILRVRGPLLQCQLVETALLNIVNFQTLIATKAARLCEAAGDDPVFEFGLRRAQGPDGGLSASRAAYLGGCSATSNVLAGMRHGIPVKGTHAHSWVMAFPTEPEAFEAYASAMPNNTLLLVDTYDTLEGVRHAIRTGKDLRRRGHELLGIRLDSGDLTTLSKAARGMLDQAGFPEAAIVASNDLDEDSIRSLKAAGARIDLWGVGTKLVTAYDQPALGGVYKLGAIRDRSGNWQRRVKFSDDAVKTSHPGILQIARRTTDQGSLEDTLYDESLPDLQLPADSRPLLHEVFSSGRRTGAREPLDQLRARAAANRPKLFADPAPTLHLEPGLARMRHALTESQPVAS